VSARQKAERYKPLVAANAVSKQEYDEAVAAAGQANADIAAAKAAVTTAQINLGYTTVTAPISGRVGRALVTEGALVGKGEATKLTTVEQVEPIWVTFTQRRKWRACVAPSRPAGQGRERWRARAPVPGSRRQGIRHDRQAAVLGHDRGPDHGSITLRAEFPNPKRELLSGTFVRVKIEQGVDEKALTVPQRALIRSAQGASVLVVGADGKVAACRSGAAGDRRPLGGDRRPEGWRKGDRRGPAEGAPGRACQGRAVPEPADRAAPASARRAGC
jgi:membrane fusion protein (multidrug efflux system)